MNQSSEVDSVIICIFQKLQHRDVIASKWQGVYLNPEVLSFRAFVLYRHVYIKKKKNNDWQDIQLS